MRTAAMHPLLDAKPLRDFILRDLKRHECFEDAAREWGINPRSIRRVLSGEHSRVSLDLADQIVTRSGHPELLRVLWPETAA